MFQLKFKYIIYVSIIALLIITKRLWISVPQQSKESQKVSRWNIIKDEYKYKSQDQAQDISYSGTYREVIQKSQETDIPFESSSIVQSAQNNYTESNFDPLQRVNNVTSIINDIRKPCGSHLENNQHFVDKSFWHSIDSNEMYKRSQAIKSFIQNDIPKFKYDRFNFDGFGIIFTASGNTLQRALSSIRILRRVHMVKIPIQVWYMGSELSDDQKAEIIAEDAVPKDLLVEQKRLPDIQFNVNHAYGGSRNYHIKSLVILLVNFQHILYLDSDNYALRNPLFLFESEQYKQTGTIFWKDFWKFLPDNPIWQITGIKCHDEFEMESGQIVVNKKIAWDALLLSLHFQKNHEFYFKILLGDKDTFRLSWKILNKPYHYIEQPPAIAGRVRSQRFCGHTMVQFGTDGEILFAHTTSMKSTHSIREGNTWESIKFLQPATPSRIDSISDSEVKITSGYPVYYEFSGGAEKSKEDGGVGNDVLSNNCLDVGIQMTPIITLKSIVSKYGPQKASDSFRSVQENWNTYSDGKFSWFESAFYKFGGPSSGNEATCGNGNVGNGKCQNPDDCCSPYGWCGQTIDHCGVDCAGGPCYKDRKLPQSKSQDFEFCGDGVVGYGLCKEEGMCCSRFGYCGSTATHCNVDVCISGNCLTPKL